MLILPGILLVTLSNPFFTSSRASMTTGVVSIFVSYIPLISVSRSLYLDNFSGNFAEASLSGGTVMSMLMHYYYYHSSIISLLSHLSVNIITAIIVIVTIIVFLPQFPILHHHNNNNNNNNIKRVSERANVTERCEQACQIVTVDVTFLQLESN